MASYVRGVIMINPYHKCIIYDCDWATKKKYCEKHNVCEICGKHE